MPWEFFKCLDKLWRVNQGETSEGIKKSFCVLNRLEGRYRRMFIKHLRGTWRCCLEMLQVLRAKGRNDGKCVFVAGRNLGGKNL